MITRGADGWNSMTFARNSTPLIDGMRYADDEVKILLIAASNRSLGRGKCFEFQRVAIEVVRIDRG